ncbi:MAG: hypothetical protein HFJ12_05805 [Bacilli bacterium]|nr:hypothetical protein [Bacilli bacterium]
MKKIIKKNYKIILGIIIGGIISGVGVYAATMISSSNISYDNSKSGLTSTNLNGAIDELYEKAKKLSNSGDKPCKLIKGTGESLGDEIQCGTESFYVLYTLGNAVQTITKYPIEQGYMLTSIPTVIANPSYLQNEECNQIDCAPDNSSAVSQYSANLKKLGISVGEVSRPSIKDFKKAGAITYSSIEYCESTQYIKSIKDLNITNLSKLGIVSNTYIWENKETTECVDNKPSSQIGLYINSAGLGDSGFGPNEKLTVIIPKADIIY